MNIPEKKNKRFYYQGTLQMYLTLTVNHHFLSKQVILYSYMNMYDSVKRPGFTNTVVADISPRLNPSFYR